MTTDQKDNQKLARVQAEFFKAGFAYRDCLDCKCSYEEKSGASPERKQKVIDIIRSLGLDPDRVQEEARKNGMFMAYTERFSLALDNQFGGCVPVRYFAEFLATLLP